MAALAGPPIVGRCRDGALRPGLPTSFGRTTRVSGDRAHLQEWYRQAMRGRVDELRGLRSRVAEGNHLAEDEARQIGMSLRGSGATFGFPHITAIAGLLETSRDEEVLRRVEGLIAELRRFSSEDGEVAEASEGHSVAEWLILAAGLSPDFVPLAQDEHGAWERVSRAAGCDESELAARVAEYFRIEVVNARDRSSGARRLVPEALATQARVVPLREDSLTITLATADPTALATEAELERLTGRRPVFEVGPPALIDALLDDGAPAPAPTPRPEVVGVIEPAPSEPSDQTVLVVDDEPSARILVRALLEKRGHPVVEATDGVDALQRLGESGPFSLVLADLNMPRMDGLELIWEIRDAPTLRHLPVIVVTGEKDEILETQLMEEGADDYIRKPIDPRLFVARIESTLRRLGGEHRG